MGDGWRRRQRRKSSSTRDGGTRTSNMDTCSSPSSRPITDGLIEGTSILQRSEGRAAVWGEQ
jgi:hypothetical protein